MHTWWKGWVKTWLYLRERLMWPSNLRISLPNSKEYFSKSKSYRHQRDINLHVLLISYFYFLNYCIRLILNYRFFNNLMILCNFLLRQRLLSYQRTCPFFNWYMIFYKQCQLRFMFKKFLDNGLLCWDMNIVLISD